MLPFVNATLPDRHETVEIMHDVFESVKTIRTLSFDFHSKERIKGEISSNSSHITLTRQPYQLYLRETTPNDGLEVLFPHPQDPSQALVNPNGFPWMNLKLDPLGELMTKDQHHTVHMAGYDYMISVIEYNFNKYHDRLTEIVDHQGFIDWKGTKCHNITLNNTSFRFARYRTKPGESIHSIANERRLNAYMISEKNDREDISKVLTPGTELLIPSDYARKITMYIDQKRNIPLMIRVYDDIGIFESYEFENIEVNPRLSVEALNAKFVGYRF